MPVNDDFFDRPSQSLGSILQERPQTLEEKLQSQFRANTKNTIETLVRGLRPSVRDSEALQDSLFKSLTQTPIGCPDALERYKVRSGYSRGTKNDGFKGHCTGTLDQKGAGVYELSLDFAGSVETKGKASRRLIPVTLRSKAERNPRTHHWQSTFRGAYPQTKARLRSQ